MITKPRGTADIILGDVFKWRHIEGIFRQLCQEYNYHEVRTPIFEYTELFERGVGDTTDIVEKEMYTFLDRGGRSITLRPEGTASVVRAYLDNKLSSGLQPVKLWYYGPMFRYDRPQAGRFRQFHQLGAEVIGSEDPATDAELIAMLMSFYARLGLSNLRLDINSVGCPICRAELKIKLQDFFRPHMDRLCHHCQGRIDRNPLRILDCKVEACKTIGKDAPTTLDCLCRDCEDHFIKVKDHLNQINIPYNINGRMVRGLDYYTKTAFEIAAPEIGAQSAIGGGGRYDGLVESIGGNSTPGVGYALGVERILLAMENQKIAIPEEPALDVFIASADEQGSSMAFSLLETIRNKGISGDKDYLGRSLKSQMKHAGKTGCSLVVILGGQELSRGVAAVKDMRDGRQIELSVDKISEEIIKILGK
ncbi:MAG: histidine--tRNA ligase [Peptococcaceae bacterium]|nr:histidine--tRNA ligase [Peptococcaceae bacterium]